VGDTLDSKKFGFDRRAVQSSAAIADGMVFVGSRDGAIYGLDEATGERRWRVSHGGSWVIGSPAVADGRVYVGSSDGHFAQALDRASGRELWHLATGAVRWRLRLDEAANSSPAAADGELYLGTEAGSVLAIHEVSATVPRLAVFYDPTLRGEPAVAGGPLAGEYFRQQGYEVLDAGAFSRFLAERTADGVPSAVVLATDVCLTRRLRSGGHAPVMRISGRALIPSRASRDDRYGPRPTLEGSLVRLEPSAWATSPLCAVGLDPKL
jgi:hypothetical protein